MHWCARYAGPDVRMLAPVLIAVTALLSPMAREAHATTRGRGCHRQCASTFIDTLEQRCASVPPARPAAYLTDSSEGKILVVAPVPSVD